MGPLTLTFSNETMSKKPSEYSRSWGGWHTYALRDRFRTTPSVVFQSATYRLRLCSWYRLATVTSARRSANTLDCPSLWMLKFPGRLTVSLEELALSPSAPERFERGVGEVSVPREALVCDSRAFFLRLSGSIASFFSFLSLVKLSAVLGDRKSDLNCFILYG